MSATLIRFFGWHGPVKSVSQTEMTHHGLLVDLLLEILIVRLSSGVVSVVVDVELHLELPLLLQPPLLQLLLILDDPRSII